MNSAIIHSKLSRSEQFLALDDTAALLCLMALTHCDDYGRIKASPTHWALNVCPGRHNVQTIKAAIQSILDNKDAQGRAILTSYEVNGEQFLYYTSWFRYQGWDPKYTLRALCPHPVLGVCEPNVRAGYLKKFAGDRLPDYNRDGNLARAFLNRNREEDREDREVHEKEEKTPEPTGQKPEETAKPTEVTQKPDDQKRNRSGKPATNSGTDSELGGKIDPSSSSPSSSASSSSSASPSSSQSSSSSDARDASLEGMEPEMQVLVSAVLESAERVPRFAGFEVDVGQLSAMLGLWLRGRHAQDLLRQLPAWEAHNANPDLGGKRTPIVQALNSWLERVRWPSPGSKSGMKALGAVLSNRQAGRHPQPGPDYVLRDIPGTNDGRGNPRVGWFIPGTDKPFDREAWYDQPALEIP